MTNWPKGKKLGELTKEQQKDVMKKACVTIMKELTTEVQKALVKKVVEEKSK